MNFTHTEASVAERFGLSRQAVRKMRADLLMKDVDWEKTRGEVHISDAGLEKLAKNAALAVESLPPVEVAACASMLSVWRVTRNPHIIEAFVPGTDPALRANIVRVRVKNAANFRRTGGDGKPMTFPAAHVQADLYELVGACPRRVGRW